MHAGATGQRNPRGRLRRRAPHEIGRCCCCVQALPRLIAGALRCRYRRPTSAFLASRPTTTRWTWTWRKSARIRRSARSSPRATAHAGAGRRARFASPIGVPDARPTRADLSATSITSARVLCIRYADYHAIMSSMCPRALSRLDEAGRARRKAHDQRIVDLLGPVRSGDPDAKTPATSQPAPAFLSRCARTWAPVTAPTFGTVCDGPRERPDC